MHEDDGQKHRQEDDPLTIIVISICLAEPSNMDVTPHGLQAREDLSFFRPVLTNTSDALSPH